MARSRKSPPLFDVMGEAVKRAAATAGPAPSRGPADTAEAHRPVIRVVGGGGTGSGGAEPSRPNTGYPRLPPSSREEDPRPSPEWAVGDAPHEWRLFGLPAQHVLIAFSALLLIVSLTAMIAFRLGKAQEASDILGQDHNGPPPSLTGPGPASPTNNGAPATDRQPDRSARQSKGTSAPAPEPPAPQLPVIGDDPRMPGNDYLIVESLTLKDAEPAARFLVENGVPAVVVPPQGVDAAKLSQDPRGMWWVIVRQGLTSEEFKSGDPRKNQLLAAVKKIGRRWKQDHKGSTDFSTAFWRLYSK